MKTGAFVVVVAVVLAAGLVLTSSDAHAWGPNSGGSDMIRDRIVPHGFFTLPEPRRVESRRPLNNQRRFVGPNTFIGSGATVVGVYAPPVYAEPGYAGPMEDPTTVFIAQPVYFQPVNNIVSAAPPAPAPSMPAAPPMPSVVEYPMGRFELRGDGMMSPYNWVWIPNPPPPPPVAAPPAGPVFSPTGPAFSDDRPSFSSRRVYRWTDEQGVIYVTDRLDAVPSRYRTQAAQAPPS